MDNLLLDNEQTKAYVPKCKKCGDFGYTLPPGVDFRGCIPAGIMFAIGNPCAGPFGRIFEVQKAQWELPIPKTREAFL